MRISTIENYLQAIYKLGHDGPGEGVSTLALAARMSVAPRLATAMVKTRDSLQLEARA